MPPADRYLLAYHGPCSSVLDQRSVMSGPRPCSAWIRGQTTLSYTILQKRVKYSKSLQRYQSSVQEQKGLWAGELTCLGRTALCFSGVLQSCQGIRSVIHLFLSVLLIGTSSGNVLLIISSHLSHMFLGWCARLGPFTQKCCP